MDKFHEGIIRDFFTKYVYIISILLMSLTVCVIYYTGYYASDDLSSSYVPNLYRILNAEPLTDIIRLPMIIHIFIGYLIFGFEGIPIAFTILYPTLILLTYMLVNLISGKYEASIAATVVFGMSTFYIYSGAVLPDNLLAVFIILSYISIIYTYKQQITFRKYIFACITGLLAACVFLMKEPYLLLLVGFFPIGFLYEEKFIRNIRIAIVVLVSFIITYLLSKYVLYLLGSEFTILAVDVDDHLQSFIDGNIRRGSDTFLKHVLYTAKKLTYNWNVFYIGSSIITLFALVYGIARKEKGFLIFPLSYLVMFTYYAGMSVSFDQFVGLPVQERYFSVLHVFEAISISMIVVKLAASSEKIKLICCLVILLVAVSQIYDNLEKAGDVYNSVRQKVFIELVDNLYNNRRSDDTLMVYNGPLTQRYRNYFKYTDYDIHFMDFGEDSMKFDEDTVTIYYPENSDIPSQALEYADENDLIYHETAIIALRTKKNILPLLTDEKQNNVKYVKLVYGIFIKEFEIVELYSNDFGEWAEGLPIDFRQRKVSNDVIVSEDSEEQDEYVEIISLGEINYIYYNYTFSPEEDFTNIVISATVKEVGDSTSNITLKTHYEDVSLNETFRHSVNNTTWKHVDFRSKISPGCSSITLLLATSGEGSLLIDDLVIRAK